MPIPHRPLVASLVVLALSAGAVAKQAQEPAIPRAAQEAMAALRESPLLAPTAERAWTAEYRSFARLTLRDGATRSDDYVFIATEAPHPASTFRVVETIAPGAHHIGIAPLEIDPSHRTHPFSGRIDYWSRTGATDAVLFYDQRVAHHGVLERGQLLPSTFHPPLVLGALLSADAREWVATTVQFPADQLELEPLDPAPLPPPENQPTWVGVSEVVGLTNVLQAGEPTRVERRTYFDTAANGLPVQCQLFLGESAGVLWRLEWEAADGAVDGGVHVQGHGLAAVHAEHFDFLEPASDTVVARVTFRPESARLLDAGEAAQRLEPVIPEGFRVLTIAPGVGAM